MRYLRSKHIRKALRQFQFLCGIKPPYRVLLDGNFIAMCIKMNVDIVDRVPKFLQTSRCHFFVTKAAVNELKLLSSEDAHMMAAWREAQNFQIADASIEDDVTQAIIGAVGACNDRKYIVATQETDLRGTLRKVPGVPLIYLNRSVLVFEDISAVTLAISRQEDHLKMTKLNELDKRTLGDIAAAKDGCTSDDRRNATHTPRRIAKKAKGPNPLSVKKRSRKKVRAKHNTVKRVPAPA